MQFGPYFNLQTVSYTPLSPAQSWKLPRWVVATVGVFFGSAAVLTLAVCVVLLRDPNPAPAAQPALPTAAVATTSAAPSEHSAGSPIDKAPVAVTRAASAADQKTMAKRDPADRAHAHHIVVSRHRSVVRRHIDSARRVASKGTSSSVAAQETETASRRPPPDALDQLLSESSL